MQDLYVSDTGKGYPLVLIHGFLGSSEMWMPQIEYFKSNYRVITLDLPGFGKSNKVKSYDSIASMAKIIIHNLKKRDIKKFHLLGHSMGGMIVQEIVKISEESISKLICYGTGPLGNMPGRFETIDQSREKLKNEGLEVVANRIAKTWFTEGDKANYFYLCSKAGRQTSIIAADNALIAMKNWSGLEFLKKIKKKTLIIWGDQDKAYNFNQVETLNKNILNSKLKILKGFSHNVHLETPQEFNKCVYGFLKEK